MRHSGLGGGLRRARMQGGGARPAGRPGHKPGPRIPLTPASRPWEAPRAVTRCADMADRSIEVAEHARGSTRGAHAPLAGSYAPNVHLYEWARKSPVPNRPLPPPGAAQRRSEARCASTLSFTSTCGAVGRGGRTATKRATLRIISSPGKLPPVYPGFSFEVRTRVT